MLCCCWCVMLLTRSCSTHYYEYYMLLLLWLCYHWCCCRCRCRWYWCCSNDCFIVVWLTNEFALVFLTLLSSIVSVSLYKLIILYVLEFDYRIARMIMILAVVINVMCNVSTYIRSTCVCMYFAVLTKCYRHIMKALMNDSLIPSCDALW